MSRHEGVSCDSCLKGNFRGRRYKCLICYDYDLCATCYESGATTARHTTDHPMQCILTRTDFDLYYGGEALSPNQPQSVTCPYCSRMGLTELLLLEHVTAEHADAAAEVVCPICAALPSGDPNYVTDDLTAHLTLEHRAPRELEEPMTGIRHVRRIPHPGRGVSGPRTRRTNMHFQSGVPGSALSGLAANSRETMDPIAELLSQLSSVRSRAAAAQSVSSQLQQLEMQLQTTRQQLERLPRRQGEASRAVANGNQTPAPILDFAAAVAGGGSTNNPPGGSTSSSNSQYLLARCGDAELLENERQTLEVDRADRSIFVQELLLSSLAQGLRLSDSEDSEEEGDLLHLERGAEEFGNVAGALEADNPAPGPNQLNRRGNIDVIINTPSLPNLSASAGDGGGGIGLRDTTSSERKGVVNSSGGRRSSPTPNNSSGGTTPHKSH